MNGQAAGPGQPDQPATVLLSTHLSADVLERRSRGANGVLARHAEHVRSAGVQCVVERVCGDGPAESLFPTRDVLHVYHPPRPYNPSFVKRGLVRLEQVRRDLEESGPSWRLVRTGAEVLEAAGNGDLAMVLGMLGSTPVEDDPSMLEIFHRLGVRVFGLASDSANAATGTYLEDAGFGLSALGVNLVATASRLQMLVDASNVSTPAFWEMVDLVEGPLLVAAGGARSVQAHPGNLAPDQVGAIAASGGVVGLSLRPDRLDEHARPTLARAADHVDELVSQAGIDHVAIGFDIVDEATFPREEYVRLLGSEAVPAADDDVARLGFGAARALMQVLIARGYGMDEIAKLRGMNALRLMTTVWGT